MANYNNHFVTKLKKLIFVYVKDDNVMNKYKELQEQLDINMNDTDSINKKVGKYLGNAINIQKSILEDNNLSSCLKKLGLIMSLIETIIYMLNKKYVIGGVKNIPLEIDKMDNLPPLFMDKYYKLLDSSSKEEIVDSTKDIINIMIDYFNRNNIDIIYDNAVESQKVEKRDIASNDFIGTYEELYSNYYNKLLYAAETNNKYLSFRTIMDIQDLFDEFNDTYNMSYFGIIDKYNPGDLNNIVIEYEKLLNEWLKIYRELNIEVNIIESLDELYTDNFKKEI